MIDQDNAGRDFDPTTDVDALVACFARARTVSPAARDRITRLDVGPIIPISARTYTNFMATRHISHKYLTYLLYDEIVYPIDREAFTWHSTDDNPERRQPARPRLRRPP